LLCRNFFFLKKFKLKNFRVFDLAKTTVSSTRKWPKLGHESGKMKGSFYILAYQLENVAKIWIEIFSCNPGNLGYFFLEESFAKVKVKLLRSKFGKSLLKVKSEICIDP
jgi:hypothetical protein